MRIRVFFMAVAACLLWSRPVGADGRITTIKVVDGKVDLTIATTIGEYYQVQCSTNLAEAGWVDAGEKFVAEINLTQRLLDAEASSCLFRVVVLEDPINPDSPPPPPPPPPV
jgi:hypothetical protein